MRLELARVLEARRQISSVFVETPQYECEPLGEVLGRRVVLKVETLNPVRSFKGRGTDTVLARLQERGVANAVVCASAGKLLRRFSAGAM
jgi:threonine dehydratase